MALTELTPEYALIIWCRLPCVLPCRCIPVTR